MIPLDAARYETIGHDYASTRREDPHLRDRILASLRDSTSVVNVGAGAGSYEPNDRYVIAVEPSDVMARQRRADRVPALRGSAYPLPLRDDSVDAAMAVLTVHHWDDELEPGVRELRRVARGPVVIVTYDPAISAQMWLTRDYLPEAARLDAETFPAIEQLERWLGGDVTTEVVLTPRDSPDWNFASFWAHPERVLDGAARAATSTFSRMSDDVVDRVVGEVERDLRDGTWDERNGPLRAMNEFDAGMRLVVST